MIKNVRYEFLDGWLFWYDSEEDLWKATSNEDFVNSIKKPGKLRILAATSLDQLFMYITEDSDIN